MGTQEDKAPVYVIEQRDEIEIRVGPDNHVILTQEGFGGEESFVWIHPDDVDQLIEHMLKAKEQALLARCSKI